MRLSSLSENSRRATFDLPIAVKNKPFWPRKSFVRGVPLPMLMEILLGAATAAQQRIALRFVRPNGETEHLTFGELDRRARCVSEYLRQRSADGDSVLLVFPTGLEFLPAFLGCLYARVLAVPVAVPLRAEDRNRIRQIARNCNAVMGLVTREISGKLNGFDHEIANPLGRPVFEWVSVEDILAGVVSYSVQSPSASTSIPSECSDRVVYLQYTSGSTHYPRGVEITTSGLLHNLRCLVEALALGPDDVCVTWLPHFHDMGLVGTLLAPLFVGASSVLLSPFDFVRAPVKWLQAFTRFRGTYTAAPNFGYELCAQRVAPLGRVDLDLSSWRAAANGSEPVRADTVRRFTATFAEVGFHPSAMAPCYGLAEATLVVSMSRPSNPVSIVSFDRNLLSQGVTEESNAESAVTLVGCGTPVLGTEIAIVDPAARCRQAPNSVGEIWVRSDSIAIGYRNSEAKFSDCFSGRIKNEEGSFLRTGDLGFVFNNELYVTGRIKDLIIVSGRNIHPQDIEFTAQEAHAGLRANRCVAFQVNALAEEGVVILHEAKASLRAEEFDEAVVKVRAAINRVYRIDPLEIAILPRRTIALTSSGKLARWQTRSAWMEHRMPFMARWSRIPAADERPAGQKAGLTSVLAGR
jgi:acyl-CoA synthetase (AMP-forming)/AMP-acid ligase II